jgi:hypothetical protein
MFQQQLKFWKEGLTTTTKIVLFVDNGAVWLYIYVMLHCITKSSLELEGKSLGNMIPIEKEQNPPIWRKSLINMTINSFSLFFLFIFNSYSFAIKNGIHVIVVECTNNIFEPASGYSSHTTHPLLFSLWI